MIGTPATESIREPRYSSVLLSIQCRSSNTRTRGRSRAPRSDSARMASKTLLRRAARPSRRRPDRPGRPTAGTARTGCALELAHAPHAVLDLGDDLGLAVELLDAEVLPELVDERQERDRLAEGDALALQPGDGLARLGQSRGGTRAAAATCRCRRRPRWRHTCPRPALTWAKRSSRVATSRTRPTSGVSPRSTDDVEARPPLPARRSTSKARTGAWPLTVTSPRSSGLEEAGDELVRRLGHHHAARPGDLLHPRRQVRRVADRRVVHAQVVADPARPPPARC